MSALSAFPPAPQEMVADPLVDAAVRQCDDFLSSPSVKIQVGKIEEFDVVHKNVFFGLGHWQSKTIRFPVTSGDDKNAPPVLFVTITIPKYDEFVISITTADGRIVARTSPYAPEGGHGAPIFPPAKPGAWVEWGGAHHGHVDFDTTKRMALVPCCPSMTRNSVGPTEAVSVRPDTLSPRYVLATLAVPLLCFGVPLMFVALLCCHESTDVMNRNTGERLAKKSYGGCVPFCAEFRGFEYVHGMEVPLHGMNREQRRLTFLAFVFELAQSYSAEPKSNGGGGGGGDGGGGGG
jgi:hypothetical protein